MNACDEDTTTPFPSCNDVLPGQRGLEVVAFEIIETNGTIRDNARVFAERPFSPIVFNYDIKIPHALTEIKLRPNAINDNATISVVKVGENTELFLNKSSGDLSDIIPLQAGTNETLRVMVSGETYDFNLIRGPQNPTAIFSFGTPTATVDEGEDITFTAMLGNVSGSYEYSLRQRDTVLNEGQDTTTTLAITVTIPDTSVDDANVTMQDITYTLEVFDGFDSVSSELMLTVTKIDNGVPQLELRISGSSLTINSTADPDDGPDSPGTFRYEWQSRDEGDNSWTTLADTDNSYSVPGGSANTIRYRVTVTHTDGQGNGTNYDTIGPFPADVDGDDDRLIDIYYLEDLDVVRYQADGGSYQINPLSENITGNIGAGCPTSGCNGYELRRDLDFAVDGSYIDATSNKDKWTVADHTNDSDNGWQPIGSVDDPFDAIFNGNNYRISNLQINRDTDDDAYIGLFAALSGDARIENVGLLNIDIEGRGYASGLVAQSKGAIINSYVQGGEVMGSQHNVGGLVAINDRDDSNTGVIVSSYVDVITTSTDTLLSGGLVANNKGRIRNSYAAGRVSGTCDVGGLVAENGSMSEIINSYVSAAVNRSGSCTAGSSRAGGLVANNSGLIRNSYVRGRITATGMVGALVAVRTAGTVESSYWDIMATGITADTADTEAKTSNELQMPTNANANDENSIYENWNVADFADWDFGASGEYPILRYNSPSDISTVSVCDDNLDTALPPCGGVLLGQGDRGLSNLLLFADGNPATLNEPFSPSIFTGYTIDIVNKRELELVPYALNPLSDFISITVNTTTTDFFMGKRSGEQSLPIPLEVGELRLTISVGTGPDDALIDYRVIANVTTSEINITSISPEMINEGDSVSLSATVTGGDSNLYNYRWSVTPASLIARRDRRAATLSLDMPADFVPREDNSRDVRIELRVRDGFSSDLDGNASKTITINKIDNGEPDFAVTVTESEISITGIEAGSDPDGDGMITGYAWEQSPDRDNWTTIPGEILSTYSIPRQDSSTDIFYRARVTSIDGQGNNFTSAVGPYRVRNDIDDDDDGLIDIYFLEDLNAIRDNLAGQGTEQQGCPSSGCNGYELRKNLDFTIAENYVNAMTNKEVWTVDNFDTAGDTGWQPIGSVASNDCSNSSSRCFSSTFEGNGHSISNLQINRDSSDEVGMFVGNTGTIRNFGLREITVQGNNRVGGLVGRNEGNLINTYVNQGNIEGENSTIGGLVGVSVPGALIINSYVRGTVTSEMRFVGGICGFNFGRVINSYADAMVTGAGNAGGLVGESHGSILNSYSMGSAHATEVNVLPNQSVGGLVAVLFGSGSIRNSYSTAKATSAGSDNQRTGGLIGRRANGTVVEDSYWNSTVNTRVSEPTRNFGTPQTTRALRRPTTPSAVVGDIYHTWSKDDWDFGDERSYPKLLYNEVTGVNACDTDETTPFPLCRSLLLGQTNAQPEIISPREGDVIVLVADEERILSVTVSDNDINDDLIVKLDALDGDQNIVELDTTSALGIPTGNVQRTIDLRIRVPESVTQLRLVAKDNSGFGNARSDQVLLNVSFGENTTPTIVITSSVPETLSPMSMTDIMVRVDDDNFDTGDTVTLTAMSSAPTAVSVSPDTSTGITDNMPRTFMLTAGQSGMATITFTATDRRGASASADLSVRVNAPPQATMPTAPFVATVGEAFRLETSRFFSDADGDTLAYSIAGVPNNLSHNFSPTGILTFTPAMADASQTTAGFTITVSASDNGGTAQATFTFLVDAPSSGPVVIMLTRNNNIWRLEGDTTGVLDGNGIVSETYQWYRGNTPVGTNSSTYPIPITGNERNAGTRYRLDVTFLDNIRQSGIIESNVITIDNFAPVIDGPITVSPSQVDEGQGVTINIRVRDANNDRLTYSWRTTSGPRQINPSGDPPTRTIPLDFVEAAFDRITVNWEVTVTDTGGASTTGTVSVVVIKRDNDRATVGSLRRASDNEQMLTLLSPFSRDDRDGVNPTPRLEYQWQLCGGGMNCQNNWENISNATSTTYTIQYPIPTMQNPTPGHGMVDGDLFRIGVTYTDGQGYRETVHSSTRGATRSTEVRIRSKVFLEGPLQ